MSPSYNLPEDEDEQCHFQCPICQALYTEDEVYDFLYHVETEHNEASGEDEIDH